MAFTKVAPAGIGTEPGSSIRIGDSLLHSTGLDIGVGSGIGVTISTSPDSSGVLQKAVVSVRDAADTGSESVIQDIAASNTASGSVSLTATRYIYEYTNVAGTWTYTLGTRTQVTVT